MTLKKGKALIFLLLLLLFLFFKKKVIKTLTLFLTSETSVLNCGKRGQYTRSSWPNLGKLNGRKDSLSLLEIRWWHEDIKSDSERCARSKVRASKKQGKGRVHPGLTLTFLQRQLMVHIFRQKLLPSLYAAMHRAWLKIVHAWVFLAQRPSDTWICVTIKTAWKNYWEVLCINKCNLYAK